jgi:hypothetical protein
MAISVMAAAPAGVVVRPSWPEGQVLAYTLTRADTPSDPSLRDLARRPLTRRFEVAVTGKRVDGGTTAELRGLAPRPVTVVFDGDGALAGLADGALPPWLEEALRVAFLPGYKRPLDTGGAWAAIVERDLDTHGRHLMDVALRLDGVTAAEARVHVDFTFAGVADAMTFDSPQPEASDAHADGLSGTGSVVFDLERGVIRRAAHTWRTSFARAGHDGPGGAYEVMAGAVDTTVTLELAAGR